MEIHNYRFVCKLFVLGFVCSIHILVAQIEPDSLSKDSVPVSRSAENKDLPPDTINSKRYSTENSHKFDILFTRGFLVTTNQPSQDTVPINAARSGSNVLSMGFNIPLTYRYSIDIQPGVAFFRLYFEQKDSKRFPTDSTGYISQKLRASYLELPICFRVNLGFMEKNQKRVPITFIQVGGSAGLRLGSSYKFRFKDANNVEQTIKYPFVEGLEPLRYTVFGRVVYKGIGLNIMYRLSQVFRSNLGYGHSRNDIQYLAPRIDENSSRFYPRLADLEFGITIVI